MDPENTNRKSLPIIVGVVVVGLAAGVFFLLTQGSDKQKTPDRKPDITGLVDLWEIQNNEVRAQIAPGGRKIEKYKIGLEPSTRYIYRKGRRGDDTRSEEPGALANISDGIYVNIFLKPNTKIADTIIYADWPL
jgi:hypothetical protein